MVPVGAEAIPFLLEALKDNDPSIRVEASLTLGQLANRAAKEPLQNALEDPEADVRTAAFTALCELDQAWDSRGSFLEASSVKSFFLQTN
jgi:HEAT repeat protein